jgi:hypothetical protein
VKKFLRILAVILLLGSAALWLGTGANRGWTKTLVAKKTTDEVTGIEAVTYEKKFVPGVDFLGATVFGAGILTGLSFLFRNKNSQPQPNLVSNT